MEEQLPTTQPIAEAQPKKSKNKRLLFSLGAIVLLIVIILITFFILNSTSVKTTKISPSSERLTNPLNIKVALGFSTLNLQAVNKKSSTVDVTLETTTTTGISGGTVVITYDPFMTTAVTVKPFIGPTVLLPNAIFSEVKYNPNNVVISFSLPEGSAPIAGSGRIAALSFTPVAYNKTDESAISFDLKHSELYTIEDGQKKTLKPSKAALYMKIQP